MIFKYLLTLLSALFFIFAGTGYNVAKYCCHHCEIQGIEHIMNESCSHEMNEKETTCCTNDKEGEHTLIHHEIAHSHSCEILRFTLDQFSVEDSDSQINTPEIDLFGLISPFAKPVITETNQDYSLFKSPPLFRPFTDGKNINIYKSVYLI